jgi:hypothetical protein
MKLTKSLEIDFHFVSAGSAFTIPTNIYNNLNLNKNEK